jgi:DNA invertase Pin-like site-specific DNA recombinase
MKAIILARVSTEEQKEAGNSLPAQIERLKNYCKRKNLEIIKTFSFDESAYKNKRDEFDRLVEKVNELAKKEKVAVCFDKVDRLSRSVFDKRVSHLYNKALEDKIELHFASDGQVINSQISATEKFQFSINLGLAKYYSDAISDNVKRAYEQKLRKGEWIGQAYIGYTNITKDDGTKDIIKDKDRYFQIQKAFELYATGKYSMKKLSKEMHKRGLLSRAGMIVTTSQIQVILRNPFYYGVMRVKGREYPHKYEPIISKYLFDKVQSVIDGYNKQNFKRTNKPYIFRGLVRCAECGCSISPEIKKGKYVYYHCTNYHGNCHNVRWITEKELIDQIKPTLMDLKLDKEAVERLKADLRGIHEAEKLYYEKNIAAIQRKISAIDTRLQIMYEDRLDGRISVNEYDERVKKYNKEREDLWMQCNEHSGSDRDFYINASKILDLAGRAWEIFESSEPEEKTQLLNFILQNFSLEGKKLLFEAKNPFAGVLEYAKTRNVLGGRDGFCC